MSCGGFEVFVKLSRLSVKIHKWVFVKMSKNCKLSGTNGKVSGSSKIKETLHGSSSVETWWKKLLLFLLIVAVTMGSFWFLFSLDNGNLRRKYNSSLDSFEENLLEHFNVSKNQLAALVSLFSESDQITSLQCSKEAQSEVPKPYNIACVLKVLYSKKHEFGEDDQSEDQCPVDGNKIMRKIDQLLADKYASFISQSSVTSASQDCAHNVAQTRETRDCTKCWKIASLGLPKECWWLPIGMLICCVLYGFQEKFWSKQKQNDNQLQLEAMSPQQQLLQLKQQQLSQSPSKGVWMKTFLVAFLLSGILLSVWLFWHMNEKDKLQREETLSNMCDERARMLQDQFNVSMNHVQALAILVSTFHHGKDPSAIDQETFGKYTKRTAFERPLTSGVAYALKVPHSERELFEKQHGTIKKMQIEDQTLVQDCSPENLDPAPMQEEYAPVIFSQETVSHIVSIDMMSGKEDRENILRARATGKGVLTSPFKLLKSNHLGVVLTFAVYNTDLPSNATPEERIAATRGYLGASYDVPSLVEKLLHQLASKQTIVVNVYDTTDPSAPILMYGGDFNDTGLLRISHLDFGDPMRKHEMHCRFKQKATLPWAAIGTSAGVLIITLLIGYIFYAAIKRIQEVMDDYRKMMELKVRAEAADVAKSQFLATVSHEIRTPMNGVLGMLKMLMNTELDATQMDYAETAHASGKDLIAIINEVLDQAKIESGRLELEAVSFDIRSVLDSVLSIFSGRSHEKQIELAMYVSDQVPEVVIGDPVRFRQIITNLVGNSMKFTVKGHIFVSVHLADEVSGSVDVRDTVLKQSLNLVKDTSDSVHHTLSGEPVVDRCKSWESFKKLGDIDEQHEMIRLLVTVEDTGDGIPEDAQKHIFMPFMQADSSTSRRYGGTGIGLSISSRLVGLMDGEIGFNSKCGTGTTFSFTASFRKGEPSSLETKQQLSDPSMLEFQGWRAVVIDNRIIRAEVARYHLQRLGISAYTASSLKSLSSEQFSSPPADLALILIDKDAWDKETGIAFKQFVKGPRQNGETRNAQNLPKAFLLANRICPDERDHFKSNGVDDILIKPLRLSVMTTCFQEALAGGKKRQENRKKQVTLRTLLKGKRILVVDDNPVNRKVAEGVLKRYGAIVTTVDSGKAALIELKPPHIFDACFMDFQMPEMDGFEATRRIRVMEAEVNKQIASGEASKEMFGNMAHWHTPILAMTADVIQATSEECLKCGMDGYVAKPFEEEQLYEAVAQFFEDG